MHQGKVAFGNKLLETTLCIHFESASGIYTASQVKWKFCLALTKLVIRNTATVQTILPDLSMSD